MVDPSSLHNAQPLTSPFHPTQIPFLTHYQPEYIQNEEWTDGDPNDWNEEGANSDSGGDIDLDCLFACDGGIDFFTDIANAIDCEGGSKDEVDILPSTQYVPFSSNSKLFPPNSIVFPSTSTSSFLQLHSFNFNVIPLSTSTGLHRQNVRPCGGHFGRHA